MFLDLRHPPVFCGCAFRCFEAGERHITRKCDYGVLLLMLEGVLRFSEDGSAVELHSGQWYLQRPGLYQEGTVPSDSPRYFYVHFLGTFGEEVPPDSRLALSGAFSPITLVPVFRQLEKAAVLPTGGVLDQTIAFYQILQDLREKSGRLPEDEALKMAAFLAENCEQPLRLEGLQRRFSYSPNHIVRLFRTHFGTTPHRYLTLSRVRRAQQLLLATDRSIAQIAAACGYEDRSVFLRAFRQTAGCSPREWRQRGRA